MFLNCGEDFWTFGEDSWESLGLQGDPTKEILKEISPEYSLEGEQLKLKLQYFGHLMWTTDSLEKTLMMEKTEGGRRRGWQRMRWMDGITTAMDMSLYRRQELVMEKPGVLYRPWGCKELDTIVQLNWLVHAIQCVGLC